MKRFATYRLPLIASLTTVLLALSVSCSMGSRVTQTQQGSQGTGGIESFRIEMEFGDVVVGSSSSAERNNRINFTAEHTATGSTEGRAEERAGKGIMGFEISEGVLSLVQNVTRNLRGLIYTELSVEIPEGGRFGVQADVHEGSVQTADVAGDQKLETDRGSIEVRNGGGDVTARTRHTPRYDDAEIVIGAAKKIVARADDGDITIVQTAGTDESIEVRADRSEVRISGRSRMDVDIDVGDVFVTFVGREARDIDIESDVGGVKVWLLGDLPVALDLESDTGDVYVDLNFVSADTWNRFSGVNGDNQATVRVRAGIGDIRIETLHEFEADQVSQDESDDDNDVEQDDDDLSGASDIPCPAVAACMRECIEEDNTCLHGCWSEAAGGECASCMDRIESCAAEIDCTFPGDETDYLCVSRNCGEEISECTGSADSP